MWMIFQTVDEQQPLGHLCPFFFFILLEEGGKKAAWEPSTQSLTKQFLLYTLMYTSPAMPLAANT